jgi:hypothetical protein
MVYDLFPKIQEWRGETVAASQDIGRRSNCMHRFLLLPLLVAAIVPSDTGAAEPIANCKTYSGMPQGDGETAGMVFIPGGSFTMGSDKQRPEERLQPSRHSRRFLDRPT